VELRIQNMGARRTPDNLGYYGFNETLNAYYEVISYNKLLSDAGKRNRVLFEKMNLPTGTLIVVSPPMCGRPAPPRRAVPLRTTQNCVSSVFESPRAAGDR
jgi:hypothetical protein